MPSSRAKALTSKADQLMAQLLARTDAAPDAVLGDDYRDRRVADVLGHLHAWHLIFDGWVAQARSGAVPAFPAEGYTWADLEALNQALYEAHRARTYDSLRGMFVSSHEMSLRLIAECSEAELTDEHAFPWLGGQSLGDVADECLGEHYNWALRTLDSAGIA